jgi:hypothetical protein
MGCWRAMRPRHRVEHGDGLLAGHEDQRRGAETKQMMGGGEGRAVLWNEGEGSESDGC